MSEKLIFMTFKVASQKYILKFFRNRLRMEEMIRQIALDGVSRCNCHKCTVCQCHIDAPQKNIPSVDSLDFKVLLQPYE